VQVVYNENRPFHVTETELLGYDHTHVGALLVNKWNLSPMMEFVILNHHNPEAMTEENPLLLYLDLANKLCKKMGIGFIDDPELDIMNCRANQLLQLGPEVFENAASMLQDTLESEMEIFI
jgi:HD-like signal output (HDOD) protein